MNMKIVFVGGDKRQLYAARKLSAEGFDVYASGFDSFPEKGVPELSDIYEADVVVLPVTGVKGGTIPCHYSDKEIKIIPEKLRGKRVIMGRSAAPECSDCMVYDLLSRESFAEANALPTAEGAVMVAMESYEGTISGARCLVIGFGRIGKALSKLLKAMNAEVTVASRKEIKCYSSVYTSEINSLSGYDIVFNTADALVIDSAVLGRSDNSALIIDLASKGGVDFNAAEKLGFKVVHALGLPGKFSPKAAGEIISDAVLTIIKEE